ncbi:MAG: serine hydrolase [Chloroflexi bacterium]|nr:serine hydrolase [Chloroflexota bacterium]
MQRLKAYGLLILLAAILLPVRAQQPTGVTAEAIGQANLRAVPDVNAALVGQIQAGTRYPVVGRSEFFPWLLLGDPATSQPIGWVFDQLVTVFGNVGAVPFSTLEVGASAVPTQAANTTPTATFEVFGVALPTATPSAASGVTGRVTGEINVRYGPGVDFPRVGVAREGETFEITGWHTQLPWLQIRYPTAPNGFGWVAKDLLEIQGDVFSLPSISQTRFDLPTLTPTLPVVQASTIFSSTPVAVSPEFRALGDQLWAMMLEAGFEPETSRLGALFLLDLQTGEAITFGNHIAFSGMSLNKIAILTELYAMMDTPPDNTEANIIASAMICSENTSTNQMLQLIGGDEYQGAREVTAFLQKMGFTNTFLVAPYLIDPNNIPTPPFPIVAPTTTADKSVTQPDPWNQATVDELGWLLGSVYQCAYNESGPLLAIFPDAFTPTECRQMLHAMSNNKIGALIEAGVPEGTRVAHKHGWIDDTHGDAGIVFTPGGNFALVVILHNPTWLDFSESFPLIAEITRAVYNYYNPTAPLAEIRQNDVPECNLLGNPLVDDLMSATFDG